MHKQEMHDVAVVQWISWVDKEAPPHARWEVPLQLVPDDFFTDFKVIGPRYGSNLDEEN